MPDTNGFTVKEMLSKIDSKLDGFIESDKQEKKEIDQRLDGLEQHKASVLSNIRVIVWIFGAVGGIGGVLGMIKLLGG